MTHWVACSKGLAAQLSECGTSYRVKRSMCAEHPVRSKGDTVVSLQIISTDNLDRTMEVFINSKRYCFWFHGEVPTPTVRKIMRYSAGRAIQYLRQASYKVELIHNGSKETETT